MQEHTESGPERLARLATSAEDVIARARAARLTSEANRETFVRTCLEEFWRLRGIGPSGSSA